MGRCPKLGRRLPSVPDLPFLPQHMKRPALRLLDKVEVQLRAFRCNLLPLEAEVTAQLREIGSSFPSRKQIFHCHLRPRGAGIETCLPARRGWPLMPGLPPAAAEEWMVSEVANEPIADMACHSITSLARSKIDVGRSTPIAFAVFRLIANS